MTHPKPIYVKLVAEVPGMELWLMTDSKGKMTYYKCDAIQSHRHFYARHLRALRTAIEKELVRAGLKQDRRQYKHNWYLKHKEEKRIRDRRRYAEKRDIILQKRKMLQAPIAR